MSRAAHRSFTLIEVLAAAALVAIVCGYAAGGLVRASIGAAPRRAAEIVLELDRRARLLAQTGAGPDGPSALLLAIDGRRTGVVLLNEATGEALATRELPRGVRVVLAGAASGAVRPHIRIDRLGRSDDYLVRAGLPGSPHGETGVMARVSGLTGWRERSRGEAR